MAERVELSLEIEVINGIIENVKIRMPTGYMDDDFVNLAELLVNMTFDNQLVHKFLKTLNEKKINVSYDKQHFLLHCVDEMTKKFVWRAYLMVEINQFLCQRHRDPNLVYL